jgi:hypothetical protein
VQVIHDHYRKLIPANKDLQANWNITPESLMVVKVERPKARKRIKWPIDEELLAIVQNTSNSAEDRQLNASEAAVRKRLAEFDRVEIRSAASASM